MTRQRGHLRLVEPEEVAAFEPGSVIDGSPGSVDTVLLFRCPECGKEQRTDRPVIERWCTGNTRLGQRTHGPVRMFRTELSE